MTDVLSLLNLSLAATKPAEAGREVLDTLVEQTKAVAGSLYTLDLKTGRYHRTHEVNKTTAYDPVAVFRQLTTRPGPSLDLISQVVLGKTPVTVQHTARWPTLCEPRSRSAVFVPALRRDTCVSVLQLERDDETPFQAAEVEGLVSATSILTTLFERRFVFRLLGNAPTPLDFKLREAKFLEQMGELLLEATGLEFVALRQLLDDGSLRTSSVWGFEQGRAIEEWDLHRGQSNTDPFWTVIDTGETAAIDSVTQSNLQGIWSFAPEVESFVVAPIRVGEETYGTLSVASRSEFQYSKLEMLGFEMLANGIGVALENFRNFHTAAATLADEREHALAVTAVELALAARHEARLVVDNAQSRIALMQMQVKSRPGPRRGDVPPTFGEDLQRVSETILGIDGVLDKIKEASSALEEDPADVSLAALWSRACELARGRLDKLQIASPPAQGSDHIVRVYPTWFMQVFVNLILNSSDAFEARGRRQNRRIDLRILPLDAKANVLRMTYSDNAGGLHIPALLSAAAAAGHAGMPVEEAVFQKNVTTRKRGGGYGLYLARQVLHDHRGSISITSNNNLGVQFEVTIDRSRVVD